MTAQAAPGPAVREPMGQGHQKHPASPPDQADQGTEPAPAGKPAVRPQQKRAPCRFEADG
ncbi:hypothetical protein AGMMS49587_14180 [Spirochaetia bacterium]|nr:hypothetical protein AGMMS49587_14180 [Spirochaetia bacterium]